MDKVKPTRADREAAAKALSLDGASMNVRLWIAGEWSSDGLLFGAYAERFAQALADQRAELLNSAKEIVVCAAIRLPDWRVIRGHRHGDCIRTAKELVDWQHQPGSGVGGPPWSSRMADDQGFVTSRNRYVGREEALRLQLEAGIPSRCKSGYRKRKLFSEDLY